MWYMCLFSIIEEAYYLGVLYKVRRLAYVEPVSIFLWHGVSACDLLARYIKILYSRFSAKVVRPFWFVLKLVKIPQG
jgi:hypothetical protein